MLIVILVLLGGGVGSSHEVRVNGVYFLGHGLFLFLIIITYIYQVNNRCQAEAVTATSNAVSFSIMSDDLVLV